MRSLQVYVTRAYLSVTELKPNLIFQCWKRSIMVNERIINNICRVCSPGYRQQSIADEIQFLLVTLHSEAQRAGTVGIASQSAAVLLLAIRSIAVPLVQNFI